MKKNSENTTPEENSKQPIKHRRSWLRVTILGIFAIFLLWIIPYLFSQLLFESAIRGAFSELTKQRFALDFEHLKINIFTREITFYNTEIKSANSHDTIQTNHDVLTADTLLLHNIDILKLQKKQIVKLEDVYIHSAKLKVNAAGKKDNQSVKEKLRLPISNHIGAFELEKLHIGQVSIQYKQKNDSLFIPNLKLTLYQFQIDSLADTVRDNRFHFNDIELAIKNQELQLQQAQHFLKWQSFSLSSIKKICKLDSLEIWPEKQAQTRLNATINHLAIDSLEIDSLKTKRALLAHTFSIESNDFKLQITKELKKAKSANLKELFISLLSPYFTHISLDSSSFVFEKSELVLPQKQQLLLAGKSSVYLKDLRFKSGKNAKLSMDDAEAHLNQFDFKNALNHSAIRVEHGQVSMTDKHFLLENILFVSDSLQTTELKAQQALLSNINWESLLTQNALVAKNLQLTKSHFTQLKLDKNHTFTENLNRLDSLYLPYLQTIDIESLVLENGRYTVRTKALDAQHINAQIQHIHFPLSDELPFGIFAAFSTQINALSWVSKDEHQHYLLNNISANSNSNNLSIAKIQSFPRWKDLHNKPLKDKARYKIYGESLRLQSLTDLNKLAQADTLFLSSVELDSLNIKQYGKTERDNAQKKTNFKPVFISSFEMRTGTFTAYNDSSVLSRLANINGIHLKGDSLFLGRDSLPLIQYRHLYALSKNGFYQNAKQGLSFHFENIDLNSDKNSIAFNNFEGELNQQDSLQEQSHHLKSERVEIQSFDHNLFLRRNLISAGAFIIESPNILSKSRSQNSSPEKNSAWLSDSYLHQLPYLQFDKFIIRDLTWLATYKTVNNTYITSFDHANLLASDFQLSQWSFTQTNRVLFSQSLNFSLQNFKQHFQNGKYLLLVDTLRFTSAEKRLIFDKITFYTIQKEKLNNYHFSINQVSLNQINFDALQQQNGVLIENISVLQPSTRLRLYGTNDTPLSNLSKLDIYPQLRNYLSYVYLKQIDVRDMNLHVETLGEKSNNIYNLGHINLKINDLDIDSITPAFQNNRFFYTANTLVHLRDYTARIANGMYKMQLNDLRLSTEKSQIDIDSLSLKPLYNTADFARRSVFQTDRFSADVKAIQLRGIDFQDALFRQRYRVKQVQINELNGEDYRDGTYPRKPGYFPENPIERLLGLPYFIEVDSLLVNNSQFSYKELGTNTNVPGHIYFSQLNAQIANATNNPDFIKFGGNTLVKANALLMGKSMLTMDASFALQNEGKSFKLQAKLERTEMDDLEPILRPLALIQARSGTIKSINLSATANDNYAIGEMLMLYDNMKIDILKKSMKKGSFYSFFANALIKRENPSYLIPRKGPIYFERNKQRSIFNYWAEIGITGMKTSMGLADRKTAKKIKKLKESEEKEKKE